ncbi:MAG TPA: hypothetical protein VLU43_16710 [Anaeromyxobacteraceae bacterium]|nr:hypothetical protein [Anaeromyxobacteraceae bacterium]
MPARRTDAFVLTIPDGYEEQPAERGLAFRGPGGEVLLLSEVPVKAGGPEARQRMARDRLVQGAIKDVQRRVCQPDLEVLVPLARAPGADGIETWNLVARSAAGRLFAQAVVAGDAGVGVLAFDGRNTHDSIARWFVVLESVRPAG